MRAAASGLSDGARVVRAARRRTTRVSSPRASPSSAYRGARLAGPTPPAMRHAAVAAPVATTMPRALGAPAFSRRARAVAAVAYPGSRGGARPPAGLDEARLGAAHIL